MAPVVKPCSITRARGWEEIRAHPALAWMEKYTLDVFDNNSVRTDAAQMAPWHTADLVHINADGTRYEGFDTVFAAIQQIYAPFAAFVHEPRFSIIWETEDGWEMVGEAVMYADLPVPGGEKTHEDMNGRKWDLGMPGSFHFFFVKDASGPDGIKLTRSDFVSDTFPAVQEMMKRGMVQQ
jgi:hypothetical protein